MIAFLATVWLVGLSVWLIDTCIVVALDREAGRL